METKAFNAMEKKRKEKKRKRNCMLTMPTKCIPIKLLINKKLEAILWRLLLTCCPN